MKYFITENFLLHNKTGQKLYHEVASQLPIIDYHNHLSPLAIAENKQFASISELWLQGDHYKWRAMRANGINEKFITGDAPDMDKFLAWTKTIPSTLRNPLFHWAHLELARYFGIYELINENNGKKLYRQINEILLDPKYSSQALLKKMNVEIICTTDDPIDTLVQHKRMQQCNDCPIQMFPSFRPDTIFRFHAPKEIKKWLRKLSQISDVEVKDYTSLLKALQKRILYFHQHGCRVADHDVPHLEAKKYSRKKMEKIFQKMFLGKKISKKDRLRFFFGLLVDLGEMYKNMDWAMQLHIGALRNSNSVMFEKMGRDIGYDSIGDYAFARPLACLLDTMNSRNGLPKTILYNLNPALNEVFAAMIGNFQDSKIPGKIQYGPAWWFNDQKRGIVNHLDALSEMGLLSRFTGMVTDSRSLLSFPRHEYFRRILCNTLGQEVENGELPNDESLLHSVVTNVCYDNAKKYFGFLT